MYVYTNIYCMYISDISHYSWSVPSWLRQALKENADSLATEGSELPTEGLHALWVSKKGRSWEPSFWLYKNYTTHLCEKGTTIVYSRVIQQLYPYFPSLMWEPKFHLILMWVKQCHKPPHFGWFIPPIKNVILWIVYDCFNHITQNIHKEHGKHRKIVRVKPSFVSLSGSFVSGDTDYYMWWHMGKKPWKQFLSAKHAPNASYIAQCLIIGMGFWFRRDLSNFSNIQH